MTRLEQVEKYGLNMRDKKYLIAHLSGETLTPTQAINAKCYECMGLYADGKMDCKIPECPAYPYMRYNPDRIVKKRVLTDEQREALRDRFKKRLAKKRRA